MGTQPISRRRYIRIAGAAGAAGLAGCSGDSSEGSPGTDGSGATTSTTAQSQSGGTVRFLNDRTSRDIWESAAEEFSANSDWDVEITWLPQGTAANEQISQMESAGNLPEIMFWTTADCYDESVNNLTEPVTDIVEELGVADTVNIDGESYMVPVEAQSMNMVYRGDVIEGEPRTWSEWQAEAERLDAEGNMDAYVVPTGRVNAGAVHTNQILWNNGVDPYSGSAGNIEVNIDEGENRDLAIESLEWLEEMAALGPQASGWEWGDNVEAMISEQLASWAGLGGLATLEIQSQRQDLLDTLEVAPFPVPEGKEGEAPIWAFFEGMFLYSDATNTEGGKEFIQWFMQSDYITEYLQSSAPYVLPTSQEELRGEYSNADIFETHPGFIDYADENWDRLTSVLNTGDDGAANPLAASAFAQQVHGAATDRLIYGDLSAEETVDWLASELRSIDQ